jgi:predicted ABC-type ATPase
MPTCLIVAGPNGAGKTTFALEFLPKVKKYSHFINADLIAAGLSPLAPEQELINASKIFLKEVQNNISDKNDFAIETTLAGRSYLKLVKELKASGWIVELIYLALPTVELSKQRVVERVQHGGHNIPLKDIERRFSRSLKNLLNNFSPIVDSCLCFMNDNEAPVLVFEQKGQSRNVIHKQFYKALCKGAGQ